MNRKHSQPPANPKTSSSKQQNLPNAQSAGNNSSANSASANPGNPASAQPSTLNKPASFSAVAKQQDRRQQANGSTDTGSNAQKNAANPTTVGGRGSGTRGPSSGSAGRSHSRDAPVRLPSRNSVSSSNTPAIQFGSFNQQARPSSPLPAQQQQQHNRPPNATATSGGVPVGLGKPTSKPSFGSIASHSDDNAKRPANSGNNGNAAGQQNPSDASARPPHHSRQQHHHHHHHQQQRPGSRSSTHSRQSQGYTPNRKDSSSYKHSGPKGSAKPHEQNTEAPHSTHADGVAASAAAVSSGYHGSHAQQISGPGASPVAPHPQTSQSAMSIQQSQPQQPSMQAQQQPPHYAGSPYRAQGHQQHMRPPHSQSPGGPYKPQTGAHYPHHQHMPTQPMSQPMGYPMPTPSQTPMQPPIMSTQPNMPPIQGWMPAPPPQFAYMPIGAPAYDQYYRPPPQNAGGPPPHNIYGMPTYSMPNPTHAASSPMGAGGIMSGPMSSAPMSGMTASPMANHQHHGLSASAQAFVPGRRPVRIVNPNTNEEVDISQQRLRSVSTASSTPQNAASGTASPAPGPIAEKRDSAATPVEQVAEEEGAKPKFKIPSTRAIKIVNPNLVAKSADSGTESARTSETEKLAVDESAKDSASDAMEVEEPVETSTAGLADDKEDKPNTASDAAASAAAATDEALVSDATSKAAPVIIAEENEASVTTEPTALPEENDKAPELVEKASTTADAEPVAAKQEIASAVDELSSTLAKTSLKEDAQEVVNPAIGSGERSEEDEETATSKHERSAAESEHETGDYADEDEQDYDMSARSDASQEDQDAIEDGEIDDIDEQPQTPTTLQSRSRQVTFSEPLSSSVRTLSREEVAELYAGEVDAPTIVGEILRYPRVFLERFNGVCQAPQSFHFEISNTDERRASDRSSGMRRSMSGSGRNKESVPGSTDFGMMGRFRHTQAPTHPPLTSEERFRQSNETRGRNDIGRSSGMGGRPPSGQLRGLGGSRDSTSGRNSTRGRERGRGGRERGRGRGGSQHGGDRSTGPPKSDILPIVKPLEKSENRYVAKALQKGKGGAASEDDMQEEVYNRSMRSLLNKLSVDNFEVISEELIMWGNKSAKETDGRIVRHLIMLVFDKATDEPVWAPMYARLCYKLICRISPEVEDHSLLTKDDKYLSGGFLVRKYLLSKCQEEFEGGWKVDMPKDLESAEYYEAMKIKRRGLGLIRFIGELFLLEVLTSRIIQECIKRLLTNYENPEEEVTESLCGLLTTVGKKIDQPVAKNLLDLTFSRIKTMSENKQLSSRIRFMLLDLIELRQKGWADAKTQDAGPKTIAEIHEEAERKKAIEAAMRRAPSHGGRRSDSHSGRGDGPGGRRNAWNTIGGASGSGRNEQSQRAGDMKGFGDLSRSKKGTGPTGAMGGSTGLGSNPFSMLSGGSRGWSNSASSDSRRGRNDRMQQTPLGPGGGRTPSHSSRGGDSTMASPEPVRTRNMFDALSNNDDDESHMSPRSEAVKGSSNVPALSSSTMPSGAGASSNAKPMDSDALQRKIKSMVKEYIELKIEAEFVECFEELGEVNYQGAIYEITNCIMDMRPDHVDQALKIFYTLITREIVSEDTVIAGLAEYSGQLEDMALDSPNAYLFFGKLMAAFQISLSRASEAMGELATKLTAMRPPALDILFAYLKHLVATDGVEKTKEAIENEQFDISLFCNPDKRSDADIKRLLAFSGGLLEVFPKYA